VNRTADFFYKTNRFASIRITNRIESIRIANWSALIASYLSKVADFDPPHGPHVRVSARSFSLQYVNVNEISTVAQHYTDSAMTSRPLDYDISKFIW